MYSRSLLVFHGCVQHYLHNMHVIQWTLFMKDALGPAYLSTVERLSTLQRCEMYLHYRKAHGVKSVLCREVISIVSFNRGATLCVDLECRIVQSAMVLVIFCR